MPTRTLRPIRPIRSLTPDKFRPDLAKLTSSITAIRASDLSVMEFGLSLGMKTTYKADLEVVFTPELRSSGGPQELI